MTQVITKTLRDEIDRLIGELAEWKDGPQSDDATLAYLLAEVVTAIRGRVEEEHIAVLCGIAADLLRRFRATLPTPAYRDKNGAPVYTCEQLAGVVGLRAEEVTLAADAIAADDPEGRYVRRVSIDDLTSVN